MNGSFRTAVREQLRLRMALAGPSGSGKTITALRIAQGLGARIAVIDTENRSASRYIGEDFGDGPIQFDVVELNQFQPKRLIALLSEAAKAGYDVVIVDSLSHFWMGEGGMLDIVDKSTKNNNSFSGWKAAKPDERELWDALIRCQTHLICTLRTKTEWVVQTDEKTGKKTPQKIGLQAEQRAGLEYEFDVVGDVDLNHVLTCSKTRCSALDGKSFRQPGGNVAAILRGWLNAGDAKTTPTAAQAAQSSAPSTSTPSAEASVDDLVVAVVELLQRHGVELPLGPQDTIVSPMDVAEALAAKAKAAAKVTSVRELTGKAIGQLATKIAGLGADELRTRLGG
jgi:hypothetical protein